MFKKLEGETAVLHSGGVYRVADLYERDGRLFAAVSGGFVRLYENGSTSKPATQIESLQLEGELLKDRFGRLCVTSAEGRTTISAAAETNLLIGKD
jgi:hypothetical protein